MNFKSKFVKAIGITLSVGCVTSSCAYANLKISMEEVSKNFDSFLRCAGNNYFEKFEEFLGRRGELKLYSAHDLESYLDRINEMKKNEKGKGHKIEDIKSPLWYVAIIHDLTFLANLVYYAQMLPYVGVGNESDASGAKKLKEAVVEFGEKVDKVKRAVEGKVRYKLIDRVNLQKYINGIMLIFKSLDPDVWEEIYHVETSGGFLHGLEELLYELQDVVGSGNPMPFGSESILSKEIDRNYGLLECGDDMTMYHPEGSCLISTLSICQNVCNDVLNKKPKEEKSNPKSSRLSNLKPSDLHNLKKLRNAICEVFNFGLYNLYNDFLRFCQCFYGKGNHVSVEHSAKSLEVDGCEEIGINFYKNEYSDGHKE